MKKILFIALLTAAGSFSSHLNALPILEADAFAYGDNAAIKDDESGLIWLDVGVNHFLSYDSVVSGLTTYYSGWRLPTENEVLGLWSKLFSHLPGWHSDAQGYGYLSNPHNHSAYIDQIIDIFIQHEHFPNYLEGRFMTDKGIASAIISDDYVGLIKGNMAFGDDTVLYEISTFLVKENITYINEPATLPIFILVFLYLIKCYRRAGRTPYRGTTI